VQNLDTMLSSINQGFPEVEKFHSLSPQGQ
jgi:hypothetical protein